MKSRAILCAVMILAVVSSALFIGACGGGGGGSSSGGSSSGSSSGGASSSSGGGAAIGTISGRVVDGNGSPIQGAHIAAQAQGATPRIAVGGVSRPRLSHAAGKLNQSPDKRHGRALESAPTGIVARSSGETDTDSSGNFSISDLDTGYSYRVTSTRQGYQTMILTVSVTVQNPSPSIIIVQNVGGGQIEIAGNASVILNQPSVSGSSISLAWTRSTYAGFVGYFLYRSTVPGVGTNATGIISSSDVRFTSFVDTSVPQNGRYYYRIFEKVRSQSGNAEVVLGTNEVYLDVSGVTPMSSPTGTSTSSPTPTLTLPIPIPSPTSTATPTFTPPISTPSPTSTSPSPSPTSTSPSPSPTTPSPAFLFDDEFNTFSGWQNLPQSSGNSSCSVSDGFLYPSDFGNGTPNDSGWYGPFVYKAMDRSIPPGNDFTMDFYISTIMNSSGKYGSCVIMLLDNSLSYVSLVQVFESTGATKFGLAFNDENAHYWGRDDNAIAGTGSCKITLRRQGDVWKGFKDDTQVGSNYPFPTSKTISNVEVYFLRHQSYDFPIMKLDYLRIY